MLFLDDDPIRCRNFRSAVPWANIVTTSEDCISVLASTSEPWDFVCLDHDLGGTIFAESAREDTGAEVARWMARHKPKVGVVILHSFNYDGRRTMGEILESAGYAIECIPFGTSMIEEVTGLELSEK